MSCGDGCACLGLLCLLRMFLDCCCGGYGVNRVVVYSLVIFVMSISHIDKLLQ